MSGQGVRKIEGIKIDIHPFNVTIFSIDIYPFTITSGKEYRLEK